MTDEPVVIRWWHVNSDQPSQTLYEELAREFEELHPGIQIEIVMLDNFEYKPKLDLQLAIRDPPEMFHSRGGGDLAEQAESGYVMDITDFVNSDEWQSHINPVILDLYSWNGRVYGFPHDLGAVGFWYNTELLGKAGYSDFPEDWDSFLVMLDDLKAAGITPIALGMADGWPVMYYTGFILPCGSAVRGFSVKSRRTGPVFRTPLLWKRGISCRIFTRPAIFRTPASAMTSTVSPVRWVTDSAQFS
jgi:raffinose/stachyose/melibiose transport system substrate-binding protein